MDTLTSPHCMRCLIFLMLFSQDEGHKQKEQHLFPVSKERPRQAEADRDGGEAAEEFGERHVAALLDRPLHVSILHFPVPHPALMTTRKHSAELSPASGLQHCCLFAPSTTMAQIPPNLFEFGSIASPPIPVLCQNVSRCVPFHFKLNQYCKYGFTIKKTTTKGSIYQMQTVKQSFLLLMYF